MNWETKRFSQVMTITKGEAITKASEKEGIYPVILGGQEPAYYINRYNHTGKAIVISRSGASAGYASFWNEPIFVTDGFIVEPKDNNRYEYIYYLLKFFEKALHDLQNGSAIPHVTPKTIFNLKAPIPPEIVQSRIIEFLSAYDKLIELNNKRIKVLEQMAENLYKEWFVRFRFPGYENAEFENGKLGKQPTSFSIIKMQDAFDYYIGGGWGNDYEEKDYPIEAYVIRGTDFPRVSKGDVSSCPLRYHKKSNYDARELKPDDIILEVSGGTAEQPVGRTLLVTDDVLEKLGRKVICASFCKQIRVNKDIVSPIYFFYWMQFLYETRIIDSFQLQSTGIINFQFEYFLRKCEIMLPTKEIMNSFDALIRPLHKEIATIAKTNTNLIKQRDMLLPRLMTGKLEV